MKHYVGLDTSVKTTSICILDQEGNIVCEDKAITRPDDLVDLLKSRTDLNIERIGLEAGPLSQWLFDGLAKAVGSNEVSNNSWPVGGIPLTGVSVQFVAPAFHHLYGGRRRFRQYTFRHWRDLRHCRGHGKAADSRR